MNGTQMDMSILKAKPDLSSRSWPEPISTCYNPKLHAKRRCLGLKQVLVFLHILCQF